MSKIEDKFSRICKAHPRIDLKPFDKVFEFLERNSSPKKGLTITQVANAIKLKRSKVARIFKILKKYAHIKVAEKSNRIPYLCVINKKGERNWKRGKKDIGNAIDENYEILLKNLEKAKDLERDLKIAIQSYQTKKKNGKFFKTYNLVIENFWPQDENSTLNKMEIGSTAVRYYAVT